jgi:FlaA1/EpsC-like NDP-sugar epimerase
MMIMILADVILLPLALWSAIALRYGTIEPEIEHYAWLFAVVPLYTVPLFIRFGLYRAVIRYVDEKIIRTVFAGVTISVFILVTIALMARIQGLPRSSFIIYWVLSGSYIAASRYLARGIIRTLQTKERRKTQVAIYGAGQAGMQTALALMSGPEFRPIIFFDDNPELHGASVAGIRVYDPEDAIRIMDEQSCSQLLLALPSASRSRKQEIIKKFEGQNIQLKTIPGMGDLVAGSVRIEDIREVGIEDLLGRDPVPPFPQLISSCIENKAVVVTGAGGSIGAELCRQILNYNPKRLVLFERSEFFLYQLDSELRADFPGMQIVPVLGDVLNEDQFRMILSQYKIETVYHAAAYKHVPLVEGNVIAGVMNNVFGTLAAARASLKENVKNFVLISSDKAVRPTNVMGATKRLAELILQAMAKQNPVTRFCMVRFGNVLGSSGSVVPLFKEQIKNGGPVRVTHPEVTRYFMTIPEASQLVIQAGAMGTGGEVFVLDMGESIKIVDLAKKMIELSGFEVKNPQTGEGDIAIEFIGLRPGEKLYEELLIGSNVAATQHPRIMKASEDFIDFDTLTTHLKKMNESCNKGETEAVLALLKEVVKEFRPA